MKENEKNHERIRAVLARPANRSPLFWWLLENHDWLAAETNGRPVQWGALCEQLAELGLINKAGQPATPECARKTWRRVRIEKRRLEEKRAAAEAKRAERAVKAAPLASKAWVPTPLAKPSEAASPAMPSEPPPGARFWNRKYWFGADGFIVKIDNPSHAARQMQKSYAEAGRPIDRNLEKFLGPYEEYTP